MSERSYGISSAAEIVTLRAENKRLRATLVKLHEILGFNHPLKSGEGYQFFDSDVEELNAVFKEADQLLSE